MKKTFFLSLLLTLVVAAQAQLKVAPKMEKGTVKNYSAVTTVSIPGQGDAKVTTEASYSVTEVTADGFVMECKYGDITTQADASNIAGKLVGASAEIMKGVSARVATDKDGKPVKVLNFDELKAKLDKGADVLVEQLVKEIPQITEIMTKDVIKQQIMEKTTEKVMLQSLQEATNPLALNGKTVMTGAQEEFVNKDGIKMKRMYFVNGQNVVTNSTSNLTKEDLKALIIKQVEQMAPAQAEMVKQNIDMVIDSGMFKMDATEKATYTLDADGWVKSISAESTMDTMGQKIVTKSEVIVK